MLEAEQISLYINHIYGNTGRELPLCCGGSRSPTYYNVQWGVDMRKIILLFLSALVILSLCSSACAEEQVEPTESDLVINEMDCTFHNDGKTVFNNMGTVYNNGGVVYNNGGVVYNNDGVTYNNGGTVYVNGGEVFNNGGEIFVNGEKGIVHTFDCANEPSAEEAENETENAAEEADKLPGYEITLAGEYGAFADILGLTEYNGRLYLAPDGKATIILKPGVTLVNSSSTTGRCARQPDGSIVFSDADSDGTLTLKFALDDPIVTPDFGAYGEKQKVRIIAAECASIYYTLDGSAPDENSTLYTEPFELDTSCTLSVTSAAEGAEKGRTSGNFIFPKISGPTFKTVNAGYSPVDPQPIVIENTGIEKLRIVSAELTGTAANSFTLTGESGGRVMPGQKDSKTWCVSPTDGLKAGIYYASVELKFASGGTVSIPIVFTVR